MSESVEKQAAMAEIKSIIEDQNGIEIVNRADTIEVDSFTVLLIITFAKEKLGVDLDTDKLDFENFSSLAMVESTLFSGRYEVDQPTSDVSSGI